MKYLSLSALSTVVLLTGCATMENPCEDVTVAAEQVQACQSLQKQIANAKGKPILRTELERRFQKDCIDVRYYRDAQQVAICGNKEQIDQLRKNGVKK